MPCATLAKVGAMAEFTENRVNISLLPQLDHQTECSASWLLGCLSTSFLGFGHQRVIDLDSGAHHIRPHV